MFTLIRRALVGAFAFLACHQAMATTVVIPSANTSRAGTANSGALGATNNASLSTMIQYSAASLSNLVPIGSTITALGFRLYSRSATITKQMDFDRFDIQIGAGTGALASGDRTFADDIADAVTVRSGAMSIAANTIKGGQSVNPFFTISFTTPFVYEGGDLVFLIRDVVSSASLVTSLALDAIDPLNTNGAITTLSGANADSTRGLAINNPYAPIMQLTFSAAAVPEPASWLLSIVGFGMIGSALRCRRPVPAFV